MRVCRGVLAAVLVTAAGIAALGWATQGFRVATSEGARRLDVAERPRDLPPVDLIDQTGGTFRLDDLGARAVVVDFFYTRCTSVCGQLATAFRDLRDDLRRSGHDDRVMMVSITFDSARDTPQDIAAYAEAVGAEAPRWRMARADPAQLSALLDAFGVVAVPDDMGGFVHNAAIHLLDGRGRLIRIFDLNEAGQVALWLQGGT